MPSVPNPDEFPYRHQDEDLPACVPACVAMVFDYLGIERSWNDLTAELAFDPYCGTPFDNIGNLTGVRAICVATLEELDQQLTTGVPVIVNLLADDDELLGYYLDASAPLHAVVVVAADGYQVTFSDPLSHAALSTESHRTCSRSVFEPAWLGGYALCLLD
jgi:hypothetical protein